MPICLTTRVKFAIVFSLMIDGSGGHMEICQDAKHWCCSVTGLTSRGGRLMPKKGITGHDGWVITEALATALVALEQLPPKHQPRTQMDDIRKLLAAGCQPGTVNLHLAQAKCRLFPDLDRPTIYREYGLEDGQA
jgi:hypothetical protein